LASKAENQLTLNESSGLGKRDVAVIKFGALGISQSRINLGREKIL
jgi:hypothetical protein